MCGVLLKIKFFYYSGNAPSLNAAGKAAFSSLVN